MLGKPLQWTAVPCVDVVEEFAQRHQSGVAGSCRHLKRVRATAECRQTRALVASGRSLRAVASHFHVSRMAIWRLLQEDGSTMEIEEEDEI